LSRLLASQIVLERWARLNEMVRTTTCFLYDSTFCDQIYGVAVGLPLTLVIADL